VFFGENKMGYTLVMPQIAMEEKPVKVYPVEELSGLYAPGDCFNTCCTLESEVSRLKQALDKKGVDYKINTEHLPLVLTRQTAEKALKEMAEIYCHIGEFVKQQDFYKQQTL